MHIKVRFFASLREQVGIADHTLELAAAQPVSAVWQQVTDQLPPDNLLCSRNQQYAHWDELVQDGDEVAFFPPVTGG